MIKKSKGGVLTSVHVQAKMFPTAHVHRTAGAGGGAEKRVFGRSKNHGVVVSTVLGAELAFDPVWFQLSHIISLFACLLSEMGVGYYLSCLELWG